MLPTGGGSARFAFQLHKRFLLEVEQLGRQTQKAHKDQRLKVDR